MLHHKRTQPVWWAPAALGALLWHCSLDSGGLSPGEGAGGGGLSPGVQGAGGGVVGGQGGAQNEAGAGSGGSGGLITEGASGAGGADVGGAAGAGGVAGASGAGGQAGQAGGGGQAGGAGKGGGGVPCDGANEFQVKSAPGSCFFVLLSPSGSFNRNGAAQACADFNAGIGALSTVDEYNDVLDEVQRFASGNIWLGARATSGNVGNASAYAWDNGEPWSFTTPGGFPWGTNPGANPDEPTNLAGESCVEMNRDGNPPFSMNNRTCGNGPGRVLCERK
ncbi:MAG TPA: C-type lectin domain-containing protein [Polyangiaceae bacterium]|nr:C-type lectin domain-containing protein [Polyangiaceae bacterium]